ncbi:hypothetical protein [Primorskyibacter sp. S187A]|uniref:hypothetical protein n=1 Tax=Primorskyibacter sp. S187A TaxID=3415130 RepID=UPI003C7D10D2
MQKGVNAFASVCFSEIDRLDHNNWATTRDRASQRLTDAGARVVNLFNDKWSSRNEVVGAVGVVAYAQLNSRRPFTSMCVVGANGRSTKKAHKAAYEQIIANAGFVRTGRSNVNFGYRQTITDGRFTRSGKSYEIYFMSASNKETVMVIGKLP